MRCIVSSEEDISLVRIRIFVCANYDDCRLMTDLILPRRQFLAGLMAALAAPAIVRVDSLMKLPRPEKLVRVADFVDFEIDLDDAWISVRRRQQLLVWMADEMRKGRSVFSGIHFTGTYSVPSPYL